MAMILHVFLGVFCAFIASSATAVQPNIVFIVADDLGWNDVSWHNPEVITPNLERLSKEGIRLNNYYVQPLCSPSRAAFMTGYYPYHTGMQHFVLESMQQTGLPLNLQLLPQMLKKLGYATHMVGKWHLGFCKWEYTPTKRGFDTFFGYYDAQNDHFTHHHSSLAFYDSENGLDYRNSTRPVYNQDGVYSSYSFVNRTEELISNHDTALPLFLYLPFQNVHAPLQVPERFLKLYPNVTNPSRRTYLAMVTALDEAVGQVVKALEARGMLQNSLIVFSTDNGGAVNFAGDNWPLRGAKHSLYEGGTRGIAFVHGQMLKHRNVEYEGLMHAVDWVPTFVEAAGGKLFSDVDGVSHYKSLTENGPSERKDVIYNVDEIDVKAAIQMNGYKLIVGDPVDARFRNESGWYPPPEGEILKDTDKFITAQDNRMRRPLFGFNVTVELYNITTDPTEHHDISLQNPKLVDKLYEVLIQRVKTVVPARFPPETQRADPRYFGGVWSPGWC